MAVVAMRLLFYVGAQMEFKPDFLKFYLGSHIDL